MSEDVTTLVRRLVDEVWSGGDFTAVDELVSDDYVGHPSQVRGTEGYKDYFGELRRAFPDISFTIEDVISEDDKAVVRWTARGTHEGAYSGIPPTGRTGVVTGIDVLRVSDGQVAECWGELDQFGMLQQLGVIPTPEEQNA